MDGNTDSLELWAEPCVRAFLSAEEKVIYSSSVQKINAEGKSQVRILLITSEAVYNLAKSENIMRSLAKKFLNVRDAYRMKRKIPLEQLYGVSLARTCFSDFILHVIEDYDYHYQAKDYHCLFRTLSQQYRKLTNKHLSFYLHDNVIVHFLTTRAHLKEKYCVKPKIQPVFFEQIYLALNVGLKIEYSFNNNQVHTSFIEVKPNILLGFIFVIKEKANDYVPTNTYYVMIESSGAYKPLTDLPKDRNLLHPWFCFSNEKRLIYLQPFMVGGELQKYLEENAPLSESKVNFYVTQLVQLLQRTHSSGFVLRGLSHTFIKANGYLIVESRHACTANGLHFDLEGIPEFLPPECLSCTGYNTAFDIWQLGVLAAFMCTGTLPFQAPSFKNLCDLIVFEPAFAHTNSSYSQYRNHPESIVNADIGLPLFVRGMLEKDPKRRSNLEDLETYLKKVVDWDKIEREEIEAPYIPVFEKKKYSDLIYE